MRFFTRHNNIAFLLLAFLVVLAVSPHIASAGDGPLGLPTIPEMISWAFKMVAYIFNFIGGIAFTFANYLVKIALYDLNFHVLDEANAIAHVGWQISRDVANLGFVLTMIIVAFMTIIRVESYGAKKLLPKLIAAAIIVNFSFTIAAVFIDFGNITAGFFLDKIDPGNNIFGMTERLAGAFGPQRFILGEDDPLPPNPEEESGLLTEIGTAFLTSLAGLTFSVVFTLIATIVLLALAAMLLVRYVYLSLLLAAAPLVWLFWVFPGLQGLYSKWWDAFMKWVFFAPAVSFCLYISLVSIDGIQKIQGAEAFFKNSGTIGNIVNVAAQMVVVAFMLVLSLIAAESMGIHGAKGAKGAALGVLNGAKGIAKNRAAMLGQKFTQTKVGRGLASGAAAAGAGAGKVGKGFEINRNKKWYSGENLAKRAANLVTGVSGVRMNASVVGGTLEKGGKIAKKTAGSPQIKPKSIGDTMWKSIKQGYTGKEEKEEKKDKTYEELQKDHEKALQEKYNLKNAGMQEGELKGVNDEIEKIEGAMSKEHEKPETIGEFVDQIAELNKKKAELMEKGIGEDDLSYYTDRITVLEKGFDKATERDPEKMRGPELVRHISALENAIQSAVTNNMTALAAELEGMHTEATRVLAGRNAAQQPAPQAAQTTTPVPPAPNAVPPAGPVAGTQAADEEDESLGHS